MAYLLRPVANIFKDSYTRPYDHLPGAKTRRSVFLHHVNPGSAGGVEHELRALMNPIYDFERFGFRFVTSPRHADLMLISGPLTLNMLQPLEAAYAAMCGSVDETAEQPIKNIITIGDDADFLHPDSLATGPYERSYALTTLPDPMRSRILAHVPGDPPSPEDILKVLLDP